MTPTTVILAAIAGTALGIAIVTFFSCKELGKLVDAHSALLEANVAYMRSLKKLIDAHHPKDCP